MNGQTEERFFPTTLTRAELIPANVVLAAGVPIRWREMPVPIGILIGWGRGADLGMEDTEGRLFIDVRDISASPGVMLNGLLRIIAVNQLGQEHHVYWEGRTEQARMGAASLRERMIFPAMEPVIPAGFSLAIVFVSDTAATIGSANTVVLVDARRARRVS